MKIAVRASDQTRVTSTGWCSGQAEAAVAGSPLPQRSRSAWTSAEIGFHSATVCSQSGMLSVGANALATNVIGKIVVNIRPFTASTERIDEPTRMPSQIIAKPKRRSSAKPRTASTTPLWMRQPIARPVSAITVMPMLECSRLDTLRPTRIEAREIGSDLNRSTSPLSRSVLSPIATMNDENAIVCTMIPGTRNSR